jgi:hypothetical protein
MSEEIALILRMPEDELIALSQLVKRIDYETCNRFAAVCYTYGNRSEGDVMWSAIHMLARQLAEAGFNPR